MRVAVQKCIVATALDEKTRAHVVVRIEQLECVVASPINVDAPRLVIEVVQLEHTGKFQAFQVQPATRDTDTRVPAVVVIHVGDAREIEDGLLSRVSPIINRVARRAAFAEHNGVYRRTGVSPACICGRRV